MRYALIYFFLFCFSFGNSQIRFNNYLTASDTINLDGGSNVIELKNHDFLSCGNVSAYFTTYSACYLVKTNPNGDTIWRKQFDFAPNIGNDVFTDLKELPDSNYLLVGTTYDSIIQNSDVFLAKIDTSGNLLWFKKYTHADNDQSAELKLTPDGKVIIVGNSSPNPNTTYNDVLLIKTDLNGNLIWRKRFGDAFEEVYLTLEVVKNNTEYVLGGRHGYYSTGNPYFDMSIMRTDTAGNIIWQQQYGTPSGNEPAGSVIQTLDSGFVFSGTYNNQGALLKINKNGNQQWIKYYGLITNGWIANVKQLLDSSFIMIASDIYAGNNKNTAHLIKADKNGDQLWKRVYPNIVNRDNYFYGFNCTYDGGFIMTGMFVFGPAPYNNLWLVKTDSLGCDSVTCSYLVTDVKDISYELGEMSLAPNPTNGLLTISSPNDFTKIELLSLTGQTLLSEIVNTKTHPIQLQNFAEGIYFVRVSYADEQSVMKKVIVSR